MQQKLIVTFFLLLSLTVCGCSDSDKTEAEPGMIEKQANAVGHEAARMLKTPMDKASKAADKETLRGQQLEERLDKMD